MQGKAWMRTQLMKGMPGGLSKSVLVSSLSAGRKKQMVMQVRSHCPRRPLQACWRASHQWHAPVARDTSAPAHVERAFAPCLGCPATRGTCRLGRCT